jgi:hypothetical protein
MNNLKIPFGLRDGNVLHVGEVGKGLSCECLCPKCMARLVAVKGAKKQHHFRHYVEKDACEGAFESAIHLAAKKVIADKQMLVLPEYIEVVESQNEEGNFYDTSERVIEPATPVHFDKVDLEVAMDGIRPDVVGYCKGSSLAIEITYRHPVTPDKAKAFVDLRQSAIEINLSHVTMDDVADWEAFTSHIYNPANIRWVHNERSALRVRPRLQAKLDNIIRIDREERERRQAAKRAKVARLIEQYRKVTSPENLKNITDAAPTHPAWVIARKNCSITWEALPKYLDVPVPNGEWIYGCDHRVWQAALFSYFIIKRGIDSKFMTQWADKWLLTTAGCQTPEFVRGLLSFLDREPELLPEDVRINLTSSWRTQRAYYEYLEEMGILEYLGPHREAPGSSWYRVLKA